LQKKGHIEEDCWNLYCEKKPKNFQKKKNKYLIVVDEEERENNTSDIDGKISYTTIQKEVVLISGNLKEEREVIKLFHVNIHMKQTKLYYLFDLD
jgi:hypothetical protein